MSSAPEQPDWNLLPYKAQQFFELADGFDRKSLKRSYNRYIRVYKPEKYPAEFQKIRAAFEQLENELRYGKTSAAAPSNFDTYNWSGDGAGEAAADVDRSQAASVQRKSLRRRLQTEQPVAVYKDLRDAKNKSPYEYFVLATLADVVTADASLYFKWLLTGIKEHKNDPGLFQLLHQYFQQDHQPAELAPLLIATSKVINNDRFYFLTEKSWLKLLAKIQFGEFKKILAKCESNLNDHRNHSMVAFYTELLKSAIWVADEPWMQQKYKLLEGDFGAAARFEYDLEVLDILKDYMQQKDKLVGVCPIRNRIHNTIRDYFLLNEQEGDKRIVECQIGLADDAHALLNAFDQEDEELYSPMMILWIIVNEDVAQRNGFNVGVASDKKSRSRFVNRVYKLVADLDRTWQLGGRQVMIYYLLHYGSYALVILAPIALLLNWLDSFAMYCVCLTLIAVCVILHRMILYPKTIEPAFNRYIEKTVRRSYHQHWRGRFIQLFDATGASMRDLIPVMSNILSRDDTFSGTTTWLAPLVSSDLGLAYYSMAAPYRR